MKHLFILAVFASFLFLPCSPSFAQSTEDVVYFKNGAVAHGQVLEQWPGVSIRFQAQDGTINAYRISDISKIVKFELPPDNSAALAQAPPLPGLPALSPSAKATSRAGQVGFGLMTGGNFANLNNGAYGAGNGSLFGLIAGGFVDFGLSDNLSIEPELYISMKGAIFSSYSAYSEHLNYVELPLLFKVNFPAGPDLRVDLFTGPAIGFLTASYASYQGVDYPDSGLNSADAGWVFGSGLEIKRFLVDLRYEDGLTSVVPGATGNYNNSVFSILLGYRLIN